jgi:hypothetical protein
MKKSASYEHYYPVWGGNINGNAMMWMLGKGPNLLPWNAAKLVLTQRAMTSVAISPTLIVQQADKHEDMYVAIYRGVELGAFDDEGFAPLHKDHPLNAVVIRELNEKGVPCHLIE